MIKDYPKFTSYEFSMQFSPDLGSNLKTTSGLINIPKGLPAGGQGSGPYPLVVMFRGYIDQKMYTTGAGTQHAGEVFANNGFITMAPDFLGYGDSDSEAGDIFESRFQTYVTAATLLKSLGALKTGSLKVGSEDIKVDTKNIFIWGHSNGGQVALTTLEITGINYPTVLWAPVSKPFPFSILFYTDESDDHGKFIRQKLANFETDYDAEKFSLTNYFDKIKAPVQIHQGTADDAVPVAWSVLLNKELKTASVSAELIKHPSASHDMVPGWDEAVTESLQFFQKNLAP